MIRVTFCGETYLPELDRPFVVGRIGDLAVDENPYLHRRFLTVSWTDSLWWLSNVGGQLSATVASSDGVMQAWLAPQARIPLVFSQTSVSFTAGATMYEFEIELDEPPFLPVEQTGSSHHGATTIQVTPLTVDQRRMIVALCEPALQRGGRPGALVPSSAEAADRLGWSVTKFNRKLDNVCDKLDRAGVRGLKGSSGLLASSRRGRLIEYALASRLVSSEDLSLL